MSARMLLMSNCVAAVAGAQPAVTDGNEGVVLSEPELLFVIANELGGIARKSKKQHFFMAVIFRVAA
ncbi:MAG: hypothetical protein COA57_01230 [Flavobacteriales bacterium]|nr:MAG: hypothetical protein COA57_01230 [Flavobacteriales bacterium]